MACKVDLYICEENSPNRWSVLNCYWKLSIKWQLVIHCSYRIAKLFNTILLTNKLREKEWARHLNAPALSNVPLANQWLSLFGQPHTSIAFSQHLLSWRRTLYQINITGKCSLDDCRPTRFLLPIAFKSNSCTGIPKENSTLSTAVSVWQLGV